jgi:hypothetical protein
LWKEQGFQQMKICLQRIVKACTCLKEEAAAAFPMLCSAACACASALSLAAAVVLLSILGASFQNGKRVPMLWTRLRLEMQGSLLKNSSKTATAAEAGALL